MSESTEEGGPRVRLAACIERAEAATATSVIVSELSRAADIAEEELGDFGMASEICASLVAADPDPEHRRRLTSLARAAGDIRVAATQLRDTAAALAGAPDERAADVYCEAGCLYIEADGDELAEICFEQAVRLDDSHDEARANLLALAGAEADGEQFAHLVASHGAPGRIARVLRSAAELAWERDGEAAAIWLAQQCTASGRGGNACELLVELRERAPDSLPVIVALERSYMEQERYFDLADTIEAHSWIVDEDQRAGVLTALAEVQGGPLEDIPAAIDTWEQVLALDQNNNTAFDALINLRADIEDWDALVETRRRAADSAASPVERSAHLAAAARILDERCGLLDEAADMVRDAIAETPGDEMLLEELARLDLERESWGSAIEVLEELAGNAEDDRARAEILARVARIKQERLDDHSGATKLYRAALALDGTNIEAGMWLLPGMLADGKHEEARPVLEQLLESSEVPEALRVQYERRLAEVYTALHLDTQATGSFEALLDKRGREPEAVLDLARLYARQGRRDEAAKLFEEVISIGRGVVANDEYAEALQQAGTLRRQSGDTDRAAEHYERLLSRAEGDLERVRAAADGLVACGQAEEASSALTTLLRFELDDEERFQRLNELGAQLQTMQRYEAAADTFDEALALQPESRNALSRILGAAEAAQQWRRCLNVLGRLAKLEDDPAKRSKFVLTMGTLARDELNEPAEAMEYFSTVLDIDIRRLEAVESAAALASQTKDWVALEAIYRKALSKLGSLGDAGRPIMLVLWRKLAALYESRLLLLEEAKTAWRVVARMEPDDEEARQALARLR